MALIEISNLRKVYRMGKEKIVALDHVDLSIEKGKIYCLLGPSGSGKSTLLNLMAGFEKPSKGKIICKGFNIHQMNENELAAFRKQNVGFVFQSYNLMPTLTAVENVSLPLTFSKTPRRERKIRAEEMLEKVGLDDRFNHRPSEMSGGQQQRVSIARAFINRPAIVYADEPTGNLDTKTTEEMMSLILSIVSEEHSTLLLVTHNQEIARYADTILYIRDGLIEKIEENKPRRLQ